MRVSSAFSRLIRLPGVWVRDVRFEADRVVVEVALRRRRLQCPRCEFSTRSRRDTRPVLSVWRHLDLGVWRLDVCCRRRRLRCPHHGVLAEAVSFARHRSHFTRDFECLAAWLAARTDKTAIRRLLRIDWDTVGRIIARVCADELDPDRLNGLFDIGIDEVSWKRQHNYLTLVADHRAAKIVWGCPGAGEKAADRFFAELDPGSARVTPPTPSPDTAGPARSARAQHDADEPAPPVAQRAARLEAISLDMGPGYAAAARWHAPQAIVCIDPFHVAQNANKALDEVRRAYWNELRRSDDQQAAKRFKDARWSLLKRPDRLTDKQAVTLARIKAAGGEVWRAYELKEATRAIFEPGLRVADVELLIDRLLSRLARCRLEPFVRLGKTIRHRDGILAAVRLGINQGRTEALNNKVRLLIRRAYGFHTARAALALVMLTCGPITLRLPHQLHAVDSP